MPITLLLRQVLEEAPTFQAAREKLARTPIASDCLLLLTGIHPGEMVVIERSPTRSAIRDPENGILAVTNDYRVLTGDSSAPGSALAETSCGRFDRATALLGRRKPVTVAECLEVLQDDQVRMDITVQQMVLAANRGLVEVAGHG